MSIPQKLKNAAAAIAAGAVFCAGHLGCTAQEAGSGSNDDTPICGGRTIHTNHGLSKAVPDSQIVKFDISFATLNHFPKDVNGLPAGNYSLKAALKDNLAECEIVTPEGRKKFQTSADILAELQKITKENNLAENNGHDEFVSGLPENFGGGYHIEYASKEMIYASDNQQNMIKFPVFWKFLKIFEAAQKEAEKSATEVLPEAK